VPLVEPIGERRDQPRTDDLVVEPHAADRRRRGLLALEQARPRASVANDVEAAVGHGAVQVGEVHGFAPARDQIDEQRVHDIDGVLAATQQALGFAHERRPVGAIRRLRITRSFHPGCRL
jgi:hypothetical protein